ncbi:MAG: nickel pincer cofactor biosynthesis protein LarB [Phycisphaerae bacterium]
MRDVATGRIKVEPAMNRLRLLASESMDFATLDHHRTLRKGFPEVVYCQGKTCRQVAAIVQRLAQRGTRVLGTRASAEQFAAAQRLVPELQYHPVARALWLNRVVSAKMEGVVVIAAGTSDLAVAEEAALTLELMGQQPNRIWDVGVAGLHRLLNRLDEIRQAHVIVAVAGMEGALPGVLAGLVAAPVIAVPTSVGYGASFGGLAALLGMLNSCAPGLAVVNIDNGFGAAYMAAIINMLSACQ